MSTDEGPSSAITGRALLIRSFKIAIAAAVAVGLYFAFAAAVEQWRTESQRLQSEIAELQSQLETEPATARPDQLKSQIRDLQSSVPSVENLKWDRIAIASLLYAIGLVPSGFLLHCALVSLGQRAAISTTMAAQLLGHVGKYVPGKAMVIVLRAGALSRDGVSPVAATISVFLETFLMIAVGAAVAGFVVVWLPVPIWIAALSAGVAIFAGIPTLPPVMRPIVARVSQVGVTRFETQVGYRFFVAGWGWSLLTWMFIGASFTVLVTAIPSASPLPSLFSLYAIATAAISLAVVVGFASLLPGGAGVRELVLITVLSVSIGTVHALLAAIAARIMSMCVETALAALSWAWLSRRR